MKAFEISAKATLEQLKLLKLVAIKKAKESKKL